MRRRPGKDELDIGSDSFLDIIANIVGILIILIVVAGMRVSNAPVLLPDDVQADEQTVATKPNPPTPPETPKSTAPVEVTPPMPDLFDTQQAEEKLIAQRAAELERLSRDLDVENRAASAKTASMKAELEKMTETKQQIQHRIDAALLALAERNRGLEVRNTHLSQSRKTFDRAKNRMLNLQIELDQVKRHTAPVKTIRHKLTPVSRMVEGEELHFQLAGNRVAHVPLEELVERLRVQVDRQKQWLVKFRQHQGSVGPVGGFTMKYVVARVPLSVVHELRYGRGYVRIGVTQWELEPDPELETETADVALRPGSSFHLAISAADPKTTLTFWVYPDSFELYHRLQKFAHDQGFTVAARPLPFGIHIAGSPNGTKSAGQ